MKTIILSFLFALGSQFSFACIVPNPNDIIINYYSDNVNCKLLIEVTNLRIMGGNPNQFCSCAINNTITILGDIFYVAFVDSTTNEPVIGFDQFEGNGSASSAWDAAAGEVDWSGLVSHVNNNGLVSGQAVKLWIRIDLFDFITTNTGYTFPCNEIESELIENLPGAIGTDEWDNENQTLSEDHQSIAYFYNNFSNVLQVDDGFMNEHDSIISSFYTGIEENSLSSFSTYPNPASSILNLINVPQGAQSCVIYDALGNIISNTKIGSMIDVNGLKQGLYYLKIVGLKSEYVTRFVKI